MKTRFHTCLSAVKTVHSHFCKVLKEAPLLMVSIYISTIGLSLLASYLFTMPMSEPSPLNLVTSFLAPVLLQFLIVVLTFFTASLIAPYLMQKNINKKMGVFPIHMATRLSSFVAQNTKKWIKEVSKAISLSYLFALMLVIPGIYKFLKYSLVPSITLFNKTYRQGHVSALKLSHKWTTGHARWIGLMVVSAIAFSYGLESLLDEWKGELFSASQVLILAVERAFSMLSFIWIGVACHKLYLKKEEEQRVVPLPSPTDLPQEDSSQEDNVIPIAV